MHLVQHIRKGETTPMSIRRLAVLCTAMLCAGMLVLCRVFWIAADQSYAASAAAQTVSETVLPIRRGNFYDRIGRPLTGVTPRWYALCIPGDSSYATLFPFVPFAQQAQLYARRNSITPFLIEVEDDLSANGVFMVADARRYLPTPIARHLIGYLDGDGHGMTGLEKAYDDLLAAAGDAQAVLCTTTARGDLLAGTTPQVQTTARGTNTAITLTLDANIQRACEAIAAQNMSKGCIIVMQVGSGQILASTSMPEFDPDDIAASIRADDTSLINRSLSAFSAGSVFKVVLAAAAYAQGLDWFTYDCTGSIQTAGETFRCALGRAHGTVNLRGALEQSCNTYFIELAGNSECRAELWPWHPGSAGAGAEERGGGAAQRGRPAKCRQFGKPFLRAGRADRYPIAGNGHVQCHSLRRGISQPLYCQQHHRRDASSAAAAARSGLQPGGCTGAAKYADNRCPQRHWRRCPAPYRYRRR